MNLYLQILKPLLAHENYVRYGSYLELEFLERNHPEIFKLYSVLPKLHQEPKDYTLNDLQVVFFANYPRSDPQLYARLFADLKDTEVDENHLQDYLQKSSERVQALQLARLCLQASEGLLPFAEVQQRYEALSATKVEVEDWESTRVTDSIAQLRKDLLDDSGLRWRLDSLNRALGPLRKGNFGFVFARPETGKTTFFDSELTFMAEQIQDGQGPILWFNNEQAGEEVKERIQQGALGITREQLYANEEENQRLYEPFAKNLFLYDEGHMTKGYIEAICKKYNPSLIVVDQIDNIKGFKADRPDLEFKEIYQWARELSKVYGPTIGVCQAGASGEDKKWLSMTDVDSAKTTKQGAADWILGIGKIHEQGYEQVRFFHLSKNKLAGGPNRDPRERHGKWQTLIQPEIARYADL